MMMIHPKHIVYLLLLLSITVGTPAFAQESITEHTQLAALKRQIELMQISLGSTDRIIEPHSRYHFDYQRLNADLERVKAGINDYLVPKRAQPRDPVELHGSYQQESKP